METFYHLVSPEYQPPWEAWMHQSLLSASVSLSATLLEWGHKKSVSLYLGQSITGSFWCFFKECVLVGTWIFLFIKVRPNDGPCMVGGRCPGRRTTTPDSLSFRTWKVGIKLNESGRCRESGVGWGEILTPWGLTPPPLVWLQPTPHLSHKESHWSWKQVSLGQQNNRSNLSFLGKKKKNSSCTHQEMETCVNVITMAKGDLITLKHCLSLPPIHPCPRIFILSHRKTLQTCISHANGITYTTVSPSP